ncbi:type IV pilus assembly protein PilM [Candidatus Microgenomates bacterium]|nr:type IV pilus assembly protein PilM [Candidatus Microgenomates bacterium]
MSHFGLDIGSHSIKLVQLAREGKNIKLVAAGVVQAPPRGLASESEQDLLKISETIKKLIADAKVTTKNVVFALSESLVYTRLVSFPPLSNEEISSAIQWQAEGYIPIPKKEAELDYEIVSRSEKGVEVLLVASPKTAVNKYLKVITAAGLTPVAVETELLALTRALAPTGKTALIIDFGASSADIAVASNRQLMFTRSAPLAGEALTRAVAQGIGIEATQAEEYKRTYGLTASLEGKVKQVLSPLVAQMVDELAKARAFWQQDHSQLPIDMVVLSGGTSGLPDIVPAIAEGLGVEVSIGNPFAQVILDVKTGQALAPFAPLYAISVGLALRD